MLPNQGVVSMTGVCGAGKCYYFNVQLEQIMNTLHFDVRFWAKGKNSKATSKLMGGKERV